ncbi:MAG: DNA-binding protein WhiA [Firmicutes bacterium]|nr:DNA-binding protein WhiA [Bacillota bacterium]
MSYTFSAGAKAEIAKVFPQKRCCALAEAFGILLFCNSFGTDGIRIITESREFAAMLPKLFRKAFDVSFDQQPDPETPGKLVFQIFDHRKMDRILEDCGFDRDSVMAMHINLPVVEEECCRAAFLRGAFLAGGSVTDPAKHYQIEISTTHVSVARESYLLFHDMMGFYPKMTTRNGTQVLYLKQSEQISDLLTFLGAPLAAMGIMEARLEKEMNNRVNRCCNCDDANTSKVVEAAQEQLTAIRVLQEKGLADSLPEKLRQAMEARLRNPEASLTELAAMMEPPISKPAMNHRLQKLVQRSKEN